MDDFKISGPEKNTSKGWELIKSKLDVGNNTPAALYLGCNHKLKEHTTADGVLVKTMQYDMTSFNQACITRDCELVKLTAGREVTLRKVATPFLQGEGAPQPVAKDGSCTRCPRCKFNFSADTEGIWQQGLEVPPPGAELGEKACAASKERLWISYHKRNGTS